MGTTYSANGQTTTLNYEISTMWGNKMKDNLSKDFSNVNGTGRGHEA